MLQDFHTNRGARRDRLLLPVRSTAPRTGKYGDPFEAARRFGNAFDLEALR
jgi:hypothetical protein